MKSVCAILALLTLLIRPVMAEPVTVIDLSNRPAEEIMPIIQPMLDENASMSGRGFQLFIRAPEGNLAQIRRMITKLDTAPRQLMISVFQGSDRDLRALGVSGGFAYRDDNADVSIGQTDGTERGANVSYSTRGASVDASTISTRGRLSDNPIHRLHVTEGTAGYIETGQSIPYFSGGVWLDRLGTGVQAGVDYKDINTGFYVLPRVSGDTVTMEVSPYKQSLNKARPGAVDTQSAATRISGRLGEWIEIGGVSEQTSRTRSDIGSYGTTHSRDNASIWIRADIDK